MGICQRPIQWAGAGRFITPRFLTNDRKERLVPIRDSPFSFDIGRSELYCCLCGSPATNDQQHIDTNDHLHAGEVYRLVYPANFLLPPAYQRAFSLLCGQARTSLSPSTLVQAFGLLAVMGVEPMASYIETASQLCHDVLKRSHFGLLSGTVPSLVPNIAVTPSMTGR